MRLLRLLGPILLSVTGCDPGCDAANDLASGAVEGTLDGDPWGAASATWRVAETGVQVVSPPADGWRLTLVAQTTDRGKSAAAKVSGGLPFEVVLGSGADGGWALLNPDGGGDTYTTDADAGGGWLRLARKARGDLLGCTVFTATDGRRSTEARLAFRAAPADP